MEGGWAVCEAESGSVRWQNLLIVKPSATFDPLTWQEHGGLGSPEVNQYLKSQLLQGVSVPLALMAIVLLFTLMFLVWRLLRCCRCCARDHVRVNPLAELKDPWLHSLQCLVVVVGTAAMALAVWGMVALPRHPFNDFAAQLDDALQYATGVVDQIDVALGSVHNINASMDGVQSILNDDVDSPSILAQLEELEPYVYGLQDPAPTKDALVRTYDQMTVWLKPTLSTVMALLAAVSDSMIPAVTQVAELSPLLNNMTQAVQRYQTELSNLPTEYDESPSSAAAFAVGMLNMAQAGVTPEVWAAAVNASMAALDRLEEARATGLLPGVTTGCQRLRKLQSTMRADVQQVEAGLISLRDLKPASLSGVLSSLESRLRHINDTVVVLDVGSLRSYTLISLAANSIHTLYPNTTTADTTTAPADGTTSTSDSSNTGSSSTSGTSGSSGGSLPSTSLEQWVDQLQQLASRLQDTSQVDQLEGAVVDPQQQVDTAPDAGTLRAALVALRDNLYLAAPVVEDVAAALETYMQEKTAASYYNLLTESRVVVDNARRMNDVLQQSLGSTEARAYLDLATTLNATLTAVGDQVVQARQAFTDVQRDMEPYSDQDVQQLTGMLDGVNQVVSLLPSPRSQVFAGPRDLLNRTVAEAQEGMAGVRLQVQDAVNQVQYKVADLRNVHLPDASDWQHSVLNTLDHYWGYVYKGLMAGYSAVIFLVMVLALVVLWRHPAGLVLTSVLLLLGLIVWLAAALATMAAMVMLQDACYYAEQIIVTELADTSTGLLLGQFYLARQGYQEGGIKAVIKEANLVDVDQIMDRMTASQNTLLDNLQSSWQVQAQLSNALITVTTAVEEAQTKINYVISLLGHGPIHGLYLSIKSELCCNMGAQLMIIWICVTGSGLLAWLAVVFGKFVLGRLDVLPKDSCMGWQCYSIKDYEAPSRDVKRKFWGSWGGGSSGGGATSVASIGGASSVASHEVKPPHGALSIRVVRSSGTGSSIDGTSAGGQSHTGDRGSRSSRMAPDGRTSGRHGAAWWRLAYPQMAVMDEAQLSPPEGEAPAGDAAPTIMVAPVPCTVQLSTSSSRNLSAAASLSRATSLSTQPSGKAPMMETPSAPPLPGSADTPAKASSQQQQQLASDKAGADTASGEEVAQAAAGSFVQLFAWPTPPITVNRVDQSSGAQEQSAAPQDQAEAAPAAAAAAAPPPPSPRAAVSIMVLDQTTADAMEQEMKR